MSYKKDRDGPMGAVKPVLEAEKDKLPMPMAARRVVAGYDQLVVIDESARSYTTFVISAAEEDGDRVVAKRNVDPVGTLLRSEVKVLAQVGQVVTRSAAYTKLNVKVRGVRGATRNAVEE